MYSPNRAATRLYVRFAGPGPDVPEDIRDVGFGSMSVKLMDVHGEKLMDEEKFTQDWPAVVTPTFVTPDTRANARLQYWSTIDEPLWYFLDPRESHLLDFAMQGLWNETQYNPLGHRYYSCVPYLLGEGQAMLYSYRPLTEVPMDIPGVPFGRVPPNYLRDNLTRTLREKDVEFEMLVQIQTDPHAMPIEDASVLWPEDVSPWLPVARIRIPRQEMGADAAGLRARAQVQPVARPCGAPPARQPEPGAAAHVSGIVGFPAEDEPGAAHRADRRRELRLTPGSAALGGIEPPRAAVCVRTPLRPERGVARTGAISAASGSRRRGGSSRR